ncbi:kinesin-domain-containing protein [Moesziomyces antarcticus]|uniref:Related to Kinesin-like protein KIF23 n=2 Tax=Pseudozyma antarctica TaxID=84753 RepID=A0A5C3FTB3_PSEA2|nr:kinesin-domain-containing protein [Moesziomyces antarcticus]GAK66634.1 kinesin-domain-containing protein [Moesziomyces antarcticus]SPO47684.1 related to Kinesin-like protein KIF23 [Moesziomyces antarcticus]
MPKSSSRHATPDNENDASLATPRAKPQPHLLPSRASMTNITNSNISKRILPPHLQSASRPKLAASASSSHIRSSASSSSSAATAAATPQPRRKRTDAEPAMVTPRPKSSIRGRPSDLRSMHSVADISRLTAASDDSSRLLDIEPIKAYLRIRPPPAEATARPYIEVVSDTEILMHPPAQHAYPTGIPASRSRTTSIAPPTKYIFSKVFGTQHDLPSAAQQDQSQAAFFKHTTLPLVNALLQGESGLMFTYGVTNSGKSHTVMGNSSPGGAGILPRALDVIFNSINDLESSASIEPFGASGVRRLEKRTAHPDASPTLGVNPFMIPSVSRRLLAETPARSARPTKLIEHDDTKLTVDRNLRYSVFASYVEVYNEKLFDLLDVSPGATIGRSESVRGSNWSLANMANAAPSSLPSSASSITLNRKPLSLKRDHETGAKYVDGLREIKINSADDARDLLHRGQENRAVFGTMANRASSRSHGIFTIKIVRHHGGLANLSDDNLDSFSTARLSIVDLAGSERVANTGLSGGDRLKEAGNINKSLMCLGQCLDTLRKNQIRITGTTEGGQAQTVKRRLSIVPFRHSKLTELFQSFFVGEGKAVMIVNANPYDTGFEENAHVMRFSAIAKDVAVARPTAPITKMLPPLPAHKENATPASRALSKSKSSVEIASSDVETSASADVTIIEDDEDADDDDEHDPFVDMLVEKHEELRQKLYAAELRCATIEAEVRREMVDQMEQRLLEMEDFYNRRMINDAEENAQFMNRKIDLLVSTNARNEPDLVDDSDADQSEYTDDDSESGHEEEAEVEGTLAASKPSGVDHSMSEISGGESVFDDATEGEISRSLHVDDDDDDDEDASDNEESAILKPGRQTRAALVNSAISISSGDSMPNVDEDDADLSQASDDDEPMSSDGSDAEDEESVDLSAAQDSEDSDSDADDLVTRSSPERGVRVTEVYVEIPDARDESMHSSSAAAESSDSSFDLDVESESEEEAPRPPPRRKSGRPSTVNSARSSTSTTNTARGRRSSNKSRIAPRDASILAEASALTDLSDASMVVEERVTPKKKRKLRNKTAMQEDDYVEQIGDSSLVEAVFQNASSNRASRSFSSRKSGR